jgi:hypothetical protein
MSTDVITESGMLFGPYTEGHCFHVEHSGLYRHIRQGVRMAEMALLATVKTWALKPTAVAVINDAKAIECGLISGKVPL